MIEKCFGVRRARQFHRFLRHCKVTFLCLLLTIVVLRGTIGAGKFGTPEQDFVEIRNRFSTARKLSEPHHRLLEEVTSKSYDSFEYRKLFPDDDDDERSKRENEFSEKSGVKSMNYAEFGHKKLFPERDSEDFDKFSVKSLKYAEFDHKKLLPDDDDDIDEKSKRDSEYSEKSGLKSSNYAAFDHKKFPDGNDGENKRDSEDFDKIGVKSSNYRKLFPGDDSNDASKRGSEISEKSVVKSSNNAAIDSKKLFRDGNDGESKRDSEDFDKFVVTSSNLGAWKSNPFPVDLSDDDDSDNDESKRDFESFKSNYTLGPRVEDWDETRENWLNEHPQFPNFVGPKKKPRVLLVTGSSPKPCENPIGDHYLLKSIKNKIDYCRLHGIEIFYNMALLDAEMSGFWAKLPLIRTLLLSHPEFEFLWWMDSDAMFTDMGFELPWERYKDHNLVMHGWREMVFDQKNWIGLNTGSFLIRNCQWSLDLLDVWAKMGPKGKIRVEAGKLLTRELKGRPAFEADDQSAMVYLLAKEKEKWVGKVYLENSYYLHGYWGLLVDHYEEFMQKYHPGLGDHRWPFVTHFVGCKPCGKVSDYPVERCLKQMERAFNFGDNQVLQMYGFAHASLASRRVKRIRNEISDQR